MIDVYDLINIPFSEDGRDPKVSLSCWGLVMEVQRRFGRNVPDYKIKADQSAMIFTAYQMSRHEPWRPILKPEHGDVIAMAIDPNYPNYVQHFGVCMGDYFIHTLKKTNSILTPMNHMFFAKKMKGFYRWEPKSSTSM